MASFRRGRNAGRVRYLGNDTEVMVIAVVASDISMLMEAGDLEELFCLKCATRIAGGEHHR